MWWENVTKPVSLPQNMDIHFVVPVTFSVGGIQILLVKSFEISEIRVKFKHFKISTPFQGVGDSLHINGSYTLVPWALSAVYTYTRYFIHANIWRWTADCVMLCFQYIVISDDSDNELEDAASHASSREIIRHNAPQKMQCGDKQQDAIDKVDSYPLCVLIYTITTLCFISIPYSSSLNKLIPRRKPIHTSMVYKHYLHICS